MIRKGENEAAKAPVSFYTLVVDFVVSIAGFHAKVDGECEADYDGCKNPKEFEESDERVGCVCSKHQTEYSCAH